MKRDYWKFISANSLFTLIVLMFQLAVVWKSYETTKSLQNVVILLSGSLFFKSFIALASGFIVDRFKQKNVLYFSLFEMASILFMNLIVSVNLFTALLSLLLVQCSYELFSKSFLSIVTDVYATGEFIKYNSINNLVNDIISIIGNLAVAALLTFINQKIILSFSIGFVFLILFLIWRNFPNAVNRFSSDDQIETQNQRQRSFKTVFFNRKYVSFMILLFLLNLDYGYIPDVFPYYITKYTHMVSPLLIGFIQSGVNIGELFSTILILKIGHRVSDITRLGLIGSAGVFVIFPFFIGSPMMIVVLFALYGFFDSITQPFFSYFVSNIESRIKGRVLGIIDSIVLLSAPIGMYVGTKISGFGISWLCFYLVMVFGVAIIGMSLSRDYSKVVVDKYG